MDSILSLVIDLFTKRSKFEAIKNLRAVSYANFPTECLEDIFRHLDNKELLECTLVCPEWSNFIGSTSSCMRKFPLEYQKLTSSSLMELLSTSQRKYESLKFVNVRYSKEIEELFKLEQIKWKQIDSKLIFETFNNLLEFLQGIQSTVRELVLLAFINGSTEPFSDVKLHFPRLKILDIGHSIAEHFDKLFMNCTDLEDLAILLDDQAPQTAVNAIRNCLCLNKGLKNLEISKGQLFTEDFSAGISFKLTKLKACLPLSTQNSQQNFMKFLETQKDTLELLTIEQNMAFIEVFKIILSMPRLKKLTIFGFGPLFHPSEFLNHSLSQNFSVTALDITFPTSIAVLKIILTAFPNIESLQVFVINEKNAEVIANSCKSLKKLLTGTFDAAHISNKKFYMDLEEFGCRFSTSKYPELSKKFNVKKIPFKL